MPRKKMDHKNKKTEGKGKKGGVAMQQDTKGVNPVIGAAVGAAVGGVVGAAAAVALSDKETREKLKTAATNVKDQASEKLGDMAAKTKETAGKKIPVLSEPTKKRSQKS